MFKFERLEVWQKSIDLYEKVVDLTKDFDRNDQSSLGEQLRRSSLSYLPTLRKDLEEKVAGKRSISLILLKDLYMKW